MKPKNGNKIDGWLVLDKPVGMTSAQAVAIVKKIYQARKVGHAGTLDPLATGILPIALGEATKTVAHIMDEEKIYRFTLVFGEKRTTDDSEGEIIAQSDVRPNDEAILRAIPHFIGEIDQIPPIFSAIKIKGERAYDLARAGLDIKLEPRKIFIKDLQFIGRNPGGHAIFLVTSGKGAYMRGLARDLAQHLGTYGYAADLRRLRVGPFKEEMAISLDTLKELGHSAAVLNYLMPVETALDDIPALALTAPEARNLQSGHAVGFTSKPDMDRLPDLQPGMLIRAMEGKRLLALVRFEEGRLKPVRVMNL